MADDTVEGAAAPTPEITPEPAPTPTPVQEIESEALTGAEEVGEAGLKAGVSDMVSGNMASAPQDVAEAIEAEAEEVGPPIMHKGWDAIKQWVRDEIEHFEAGHSRQTREQLNP